MRGLIPKPCQNTVGAHRDHPGTVSKHSRERAGTAPEPGRTINATTATATVLRGTARNRAGTARNRDKS